MKAVQKVALFFSLVGFVATASCFLLLRCELDDLEVRQKVYENQINTLSVSVSQMLSQLSSLSDKVSGLESIKPTQYQPMKEVQKAIPLASEIEEGSEPGTKMSVIATAYCSCVKCCGIWSEEHPSRIGTGYKQILPSGVRPKEGRTIATDPSVIATGSKVILNGVEYIAEDTGGAVKGAHIDIYFSSHEKALAWGKQTVEVVIFDQ